MVAPKRERWIVLGGNNSGVRWVDGLVIVGDGSGSMGWEWKTKKIFSMKLFSKKKKKLKYGLYIKFQNEFAKNTTLLL